MILFSDPVFKATNVSNIFVIISKNPCLRKKLCRNSSLNNSLQTKFWMKNSFRSSESYFTIFSLKLDLDPKLLARGSKVVWLVPA